MGKITMNEEFVKLYLEKYSSMVELKQTEEFFDQNNTIYDGIKIFINPTKKPKYILAHFVSEDGKNNEVFVGGTF